MSHRDRINELLGGYPDQLEQLELAELRELAAGDPELEAALDAIHEAEFLASLGASDGQYLAVSEELSERSERRLGLAVDATTELMDGRRSSEQSNVVYLRPPEQRSSSRAAWLAIAASLVLAAGAILTRGGPGGSDSSPMPANGPARFQLKGALPPPVSGDLMIRGTPASAWTEGSPRSLDQGLRFYAIVPQQTQLALIEMHRANHRVLYPAGGAHWSVEPGTHLLQAPGRSAEYRVASPGRALYVLVGSSGPLSVPSGGLITSVEAFLAGNPSSRVLGQVEVVWRAAGVVDEP